MGMGQYLISVQSILLMQWAQDDSNYATCVPWFGSHLNSPLRNMWRIGGTIAIISNKTAKQKPSWEDTPANARLGNNFPPVGHSGLTV